MKLKLDKKQFRTHLENISKGIVSVSTLPSLQGVLITATESNIQLLASDGNLSIKEIISNEESTHVIEPGKILVPGKLFRDIITKQGNNITLEADDSILTISSENSKTTLNLLNVNDYPTISFDTFGKDLVVDAAKLKETIKNVSFAAALDDKRIILNGVNLKANNGKLIATATNSFRLAQETIDVDSNVEFDITILSKNLKDFLPTNANGSITINVDDSKIITRVGSTITSSRLIDGVYPDVQRLIPTQFENVVSIESKELLDVIDRATVVADDAKKVVRLSVNASELSIESRKSEIGETKVSTSNFSYQGQQFDIAFNAGFLKEAVDKFDGRITLNFIGNQKPFIVKGESNAKLTQLVLPHRIF